MTLLKLLTEHQDAVLKEWKAALRRNTGRQISSLTDAQLNEHCSKFLNLLQDALEEDAGAIGGGAEGSEDLKRFLAELSREWGLQGFLPSETASFIFSVKEALFSRIQSSGLDGEQKAESVWKINLLVDRLGLHTIDAYVETREEVIQRQQADLLELSTPVVSLWNGILALPIIGTLDSERTQVMMESLLKRIMETESDVAIIDITGVPAVDTLVAQHLIKTVTAARLMGAECIISGIRPQIAQTIVHLGIDLGTAILTKSTLSAAFAHALKSRELKVVPSRV